MNQSVLLDVGTGEAEVIVFSVNGARYCVNVLKTKEIVHLSGLRPSTDHNESILGLTNVRDEVLTVIDLSYILDRKKSNPEQKKLALICEFNNRKMMFAVDAIEGILRVKWKEITKPDDLLKGSISVGNILTDKGILLMLDFEKIITDISKEESPYEKSKHEIVLRAERATKKIYLADDSKTIRTLLKEVLIAAGYKDLHTFDNGEEALEALMAVKEKKEEHYKDEVDLLITDIEMPILDGHTLTRKIKEDPILSTLPIVIFSSLISEDLYHKGEAVGADCQISKPSIHELVGTIDKLVF